jgi:hypothetical protein
MWASTCEITELLDETGAVVFFVVALVVGLFVAGALVAALEVAALDVVALGVGDELADGVGVTPVEASGPAPPVVLTPVLASVPVPSAASLASAAGLFEATASACLLSPTTVNPVPITTAVAAPASK